MTPGPIDERRMQNNSLTSELSEFFKAERQRVFEPDCQFQERVLERWSQQTRPQHQMWPNLARPILGLALTVLVILIGREASSPVKPTRGIVATYLDTEIPTDQRFLYVETESVPSSQMLEELAVLGDGQ